MERLHIFGRRPLFGEIAVSSSKNATLGMLAASLLSETPVHLAGVPELGDVASMGQLLQSLGVRIDTSPTGNWRIDPTTATETEVGDALARKFRASICVLGPLLATRGRGVVSLPGGCNLGHRPIDLHLKGLQALGAEIHLDHGRIVASAKRLRGTRIRLSGPHGPTVTGTCNVLSAAVRAEGETIIEGAAQEPEVTAVGKLLRKMGAQISGLGSSRIYVEGVWRLEFPYNAVQRIPADRIEAATLLIAAAICPRSEVQVRRAAANELRAVLAVLRACGHRAEVNSSGITLRSHHHGQGIQFDAGPFPGLPTDLQPLFLSLAAVSNGSSRVRDQVFPLRWMHVAELTRLGARIELRGDTAIIRGSRLQGTTVTATDLRAAAALVVAALAAEGETIVESLTHLDRGYERLDRKLATLGVEIERRPASRIAVIHSPKPRNSGCPSTLRPEVIGPRNASSRSTL